MHDEGQFQMVEEGDARISGARRMDDNGVHPTAFRQAPVELEFI